MFSVTARLARKPVSGLKPKRPPGPKRVRIHQPGRYPLNHALPPTSPSYYWDTAVPTPEQLWRAERFFWKAPPTLLYSSTEFRNMKATEIPEVAFLGRSNVGKSTILNALMGKEICHTSKKPGRTRSMNVFAVGGEDGQGNNGKLAVLDMPGYGSGSREEWGTEIMKYLIGRKQLRRAFLLVDSLHGLKPSDAEVLYLFRKHSISHQIILSKVDRVLFKKSSPSVGLLERNSPQLDAIVEKLRLLIQPGLKDGPEALGEIITCSAEKTLGGTKIGINNVRWAVLAATGFSPSEVEIKYQDGLISTLPENTQGLGPDWKADGQLGAITKPLSRNSGIEVTEEDQFAPNFRATGPSVEQTRKTQTEIPGLVVSGL